MHHSGYRPAIVHDSGSGRAVGNGCPPLFPPAPVLLRAWGRVASDASIEFPLAVEPTWSALAPPPPPPRPRPRPAAPPLLPLPSPMGDGTVQRYFDCRRDKLGQHRTVPLAGIQQETKRRRHVSAPFVETKQNAVQTTYPPRRTITTHLVA